MSKVITINVIFRHLTTAETYISLSLLNTPSTSRRSSYLFGYALFLIEAAFQVIVYGDEFAYM